MAIGDDIRFISREAIDPGKWNGCIANASNGSIYASSNYLDRMADAWGALVLNDYETVMPLPYRKKYGIAYVYQPAFCASLGIYGNQLSQSIQDAFIDQIPARFRLIELSLNSSNLLSGAADMPRINYILPLNKPYEALVAEFKENTRRNIKKAQQYGCIFKRDISVVPVIALSKMMMQRISKISDADYAHFETLFQDLYLKQQACAYGVYAGNGDLLSSCVFFFSHGRAYYILVGNHPNGKTLGASHFLIDCFIREKAGSGLLLDFEGSDIRNLAYFYGSFGATTETYPFLKINRLPFWAKWMK
jgi:hypothetical protein